MPAGTERPSASPAPARISVLDYNIHQGIARYGVPNLERTLEVIRAADAHIVTLQEVTRTWDLSGAVDTFAWLRAQLPGYHAVYGPTSVVRFGNAIFSRYPIGRSGFVWFPFGPSQDQRGFAWAQLETDAGPFLVITMHMTPYSRADEALERTAQAGILLDYWRSHGGGAVVFAGDYNSEKTDTAYAAMADAGLVDALATAGSGEIPTFRSTGTPFLPASVEQLDYVFVSPGIRVESGQVVDSDASDHYPLLVHLELGGG
jgi:endonuclease/exonuclease/phosphatase family metal-dependent hydrolase